MAEKKVPPVAQWYYLVWWDAGTGRMRLSWHHDVNRLLRRAAGADMADARPELYKGLGERTPLRMPDPPDRKPPARAKATKKAKRPKRHVGATGPVPVAA